MSNLNYIFRFRFLEKSCNRCTTEVLGYSNIYNQKLFHKSCGGSGEKPPWCLSLIGTKEAFFHITHQPSTKKSFLRITVDL